LLLHGGIGSGEDWAKQVPALLDAGYRVILMDSRSHGRSPWSGEPITYELMASDVVGLLDHLGIEQTNLVGASDGAIIGLYLAIHNPERLTKLVAYGANFNPEGAIDPTPSPELDAIFSYLIENYQRLSPTPEHFDDLLGELLALYEVAPNFSEDELKSITVPVLIPDGAEEEFVAHDQPIRMAELIPGSELVIMPGTGHLAPFEQPDEFTRIMLEFLASERGVRDASRIKNPVGVTHPASILS